MKILKRRKIRIREDKWREITSSKTNCFVCEEKLLSHVVCIGKHKDGGDLKRHIDCCPGSSNWKKKFGVNHTILMDGFSKYGKGNIK